MEFGSCFLYVLNFLQSDGLFINHEFDIQSPHVSHMLLELQIFRTKIYPFVGLCRTTSQLAVRLK